jgi:hypothetical protein
LNDGHKRKIYLTNGNAKGENKIDKNGASNGSREKNEGASLRLLLW